MIQTKKYPAINSKIEELGIPVTKVAEVLELTRQQTQKKLDGEVDFKFSEAIRLARWLGVPVELFAESEE